MTGTLFLSHFARVKSCLYRVQFFLASWKSLCGVGDCKSCFFNSPGL